MDHYFAVDYADAREKFLDAAKAAGAKLWQFEHPLMGPKGEALGTDIAWLGSLGARNIVVAGSATHGVEGFCGSGCQTGFCLRTGALA